MKPRNSNQGRFDARTGVSFLNRCLACCQKILAQIKTAKEAIFAESLKVLDEQEHLLRLALNEAEALAWQTTYPHLVFPTLATEKVQAVVTWKRHQQFVRRTSPLPVPA
jgi:hypothetical protein